MTTKSKSKSKKDSSDALVFLEKLTSGPPTFQRFIEAIRKGEEWSKKEMAEKMGVSPSYYSDFIAGKKSVSVKKAAQWARILGYHEPSFIRYAFEEELKRAKLRKKYVVEVKEVG